MAFTVPQYLAGTARGDQGVRDWIARLPQIVAALADRWSLRVGEPFQPGGQCSWTAPVTDPAGASLVLKVGFRFPGGEERDEAAGLRLWHGNGAVRLHAAHESDSAYALLIERCLPGTPLGQALPEPEQDQVITGLLGRLWAQPHTAYPSARSRRCAPRGPASSSGSTRPLAQPTGSTRGSPGRGSRCSAPCRRPQAARCCCARTCMATTFSPRGARRGSS